MLFEGGKDEKRESNGAILIEHFAKGIFVSVTVCQRLLARRQLFWI